MISVTLIEFGWWLTCYATITQVFAEELTIVTAICIMVAAAIPALRGGLFFIMHLSMLFGLCQGWISKLNGILNVGDLKYCETKEKLNEALASVFTLIEQHKALKVSKNSENECNFQVSE